MKHSSMDNTPWTGFERDQLPPGLEVAAPRRPTTVAKMLVAMFLMFVLIALLAPWTQNIRGRGRVVAYSPEQRVQTLEATISGTIERWFVQEGSKVEKGDPIVKLSDNDANILGRLGEQRSAIELQRVALAQRVQTLTSRIESLRRSQRAEINSAEANVAIAHQDVAAAQQELTAARAELETNELNLRRQSNLREDGLVSQRELELAELAERQSRAKVASAEAKLQASRNKLYQSRAALRRVIASAEAEIESAEAALNSAQTDIASASGGLARLEVDIARQEAQIITAPIDGTIQKVVGRLGGEQVSRGEVLAVLVPQTKDRAAELYVDGNDAVLIKPGTKVRLQFEGWPAVQFAGWPSVAVGTFGGRVAFVDPTDDGKGNFRVFIVPDREDDPWPAASFLRQGGLAKGWILLNQVRLGFEVWRQFNGFPPTTDPPPMASPDEGFQ